MDQSYAHVHCVQDVDYDITPDASFHSLFYKSGTSRIVNDAPPDIAPYLERAFELKTAQNVWAVLLEYKNQPLYIVRNLAHTDVSPNFRRVLRVNVELMKDTYILVHNTPTNEALAPLI